VRGGFGRNLGGKSSCFGSQSVVPWSSPSEKVGFCLAIRMNYGARIGASVPIGYGVSSYGEIQGSNDHFLGLAVKVEILSHEF
jgi:hypothetical protein